MTLTREKQTVEIMIRMYCKEHHKSDSLCDSCTELKEYARFRIERCKFKEAKPVCAKCPIHCYKPEMRLKIKEVMRFVGPRMLLKHPVRTIEHLWFSLTAGKLIR